MRTRLYQLLERIRSSYWFVPTVMAVLAVAAALAAEGVDRNFASEWPLGVSWIFPAGPEGARAVLTTIAGSMVTVAGVVFSITMVVLVLASSQFGPRILGSFMRDRGNQVVLGTFLATFLYCLAALRTVTAAEGERFVPRVTIALALGFAVASIAVLIYFIDHVATSIQAPNVVERVGSELHEVLDRVLPGREDAPETRGPRGSGGGEAADGPGARGAGGGEAADASGAPDEGVAEASPPGRGTVEVRSRRDGYVQLLETDRLVRRCRERGLVCRQRVEPGDYVVEGSLLLVAWPEAGAGGGDRDPARESGRVSERGMANPEDPEPRDREEEPDEEEREEEREEVRDALRSAVVLGDQRTPMHALPFAFRQLVEIAVRALSPGINDPFTAVDCLDRLTSALGEVARRPTRPDRLRDEEGRLRLLRPAQDFARLAGIAFDQIRLHGRDSLEVLVHLQRSLVLIAATVHRPGDLEALRRHAEATRDAARSADLLPSERAQVGEATRLALEALEEAKRRLAASTSTRGAPARD